MLLLRGRYWRGGYGQFRIRQQDFYVSVGSNGSGRLLGIWIDSTKHCADQVLWNDLYHFGTEKGGMWYTGNVEFGFALPWLRFIFQWRRAVPKKVREHVAAVRKLAATRRKESYAAMGRVKSW